MIFRYPQAPPSYAALRRKATEESRPGSYGYAFLNGERRYVHNPHLRHGDRSYKATKSSSSVHTIATSHHSGNGTQDSGTRVARQATQGGDTASRATTDSLPAHPRSETSRGRRDDHQVFPTLSSPTKMKCRPSALYNASTQNTACNTSTSARPIPTPSTFSPDDTSGLPQPTDRGSVGPEPRGFNDTAVPPPDIDHTDFVVVGYRDPKGKRPLCYLQQFGTDKAEAFMLNPSNPEPAQSARIMRDCLMSHSVISLPDDDGGPPVFGSKWTEATNGAIRRLADKYNNSEAGSKFSLKVVDASEIPGLMEDFGLHEMEGYPIFEAGLDPDPEKSDMMEQAALQAMKRVTATGLRS
jgi:hypothetical protein